MARADCMTSGATSPATRALAAEPMTACSEDAMPQAPRRAFQPLSAIARHRNPDDLERHAAAMTEILAKPCPIIGALAQSMMHMEGRQADGAVLLYCQAIQGM